MSEQGTPAAGARRRRNLNRRTVNARAERIACTGCGAPLEVRNADMSEMATCEGCGSVLDLESDDYRVLAKIEEARRPRIGLPLGAKGKIKGSEYEVIGRVRLSDSGDAWNEYLLFDPQRGYLWLQEECGHWVVLQKMKKKPASVHPKTAQRGTSFSHGGEKYRVIGKGTATIKYIAGEFPYQAQVGDRLEYMDAVAPPQMVSAEWTQKEIEWYVGSYIERESILQAFKLKTSDLPRKQGVGACQPFAGSAYSRTLARVLGAAAAICFMMIFISLTFGTEVATFEAPPEQYLISENAPGFLSDPFEITDPGVVQVKLHAPAVNNSWIFLEVQLMDENENLLLAYTDQISYYHGTSGGESWSEGSQSTSSVFLVNEPGTYRLVLGGEGGQGNQGTVPGRETVRATVYEGVALQRYFIIMMVLFLAFPVYFVVRRGSFEATRWSDD